MPLTECHAALLLEGTEESSSVSQIGDFFIGPENRLVRTAIAAVLEGESAHFNPIVLYGPSGVGKTAVVQYLYQEWKTLFPRRKAQCLSAVDFARELADAIETQSVDDFRNKYRNLDLLILEDVGHLAEKRNEKLSAQEEFLFMFDALAARGGLIVVSAAASPTETKGLLPGMRSRLTEGLTVPLTMPNVATRAAIVRRYVERKKWRIADAALLELAENFSGTVPEMIGALTRLFVQENKSNGKCVDLSSMREFLKTESDKEPVRIQEILAVTAKHFGVKIAEIRGPSRQKAVVHARDVAVYLARRLIGGSLYEIGSYFNGRDHTTMMHSLQKIENMEKNDHAFRRELTALETKCREAAA